MAKTTLVSLVAGDDHRSINLSPTIQESATKLIGEDSPTTDGEHLAAWLVSGIPYKNNEFLKKQQTSSVHHEERVQKSPTPLHGTSGVAGVKNGVQILSQPL